MIFYKATGMKSSLRPDLSKRRPSPFELSTRAFNTCLIRENSGRKAVTFCFLLIALIGHFNETLFFSAPLVIVNFSTGARRDIS